MQYDLQAGSAVCDKAILERRLFALANVTDGIPRKSYIEIFCIMLLLTIIIVDFIAAAQQLVLAVVQ